MGRQFKSHRRRAGKGSLTLRLGALLTVCLAMLAWAAFTPDPAPKLPAAIEFAPPPETPAATRAEAPPPRPRARPPQHIRRTLPAPLEPPPADDVYVLSAAELAGISQALPE